ncbi:plasmolipin-like [Pectinophora gossypiella]|uniref:MARVEL domain-containing protein n=1 Tax=Pectinophora gossypiella TaxID=13191 RepID=A0A1E1W4N4_PECGO|nr:plasmolipin-like [Pectinophora gossypiella]XP_049872211.1 plasmolipin-like [Pectinophora gossypiella]
MFDNYGHSQPQTPSTPPAPQKVLRFDKGYVTTMPGILKVVQLLCNLIGFICIKVAWGVWVSSIFYNLLYWIGIIITGFILLAYTFHMVEKYDRWPWLKLEFFYCCGVALSYIILSIFATTIGESVGYAVGFFGLCAIIAYGFDGFLKYKAWKRGLPPQ